MGDFLAMRVLLFAGFTNISGPPDLAYTGDIQHDGLKISGHNMNKIKINGNSVKATIQASFNLALGRPCPFTSATHVFVSGFGIINPPTRCEKVRSINSTTLLSAPPLVEDDPSASGCAGTWTRTSDGATVNCACSFSITDPGQNKVKAE